MVTRDDFEYWLFEMPDKLEHLAVHLPKDVTEGLDYTPASLSLLEKWILSSYSCPRDLLLDSEKQVLDKLARYVGETIRKNVGGIWDIDLKNKKNVYFGIPVLKLKDKWTECPVSIITAATDRRTGNYLKDILNNLMDR